MLELGKTISLISDPLNNECFQVEELAVMTNEELERVELLFVHYKTIKQWSQEVKHKLHLNTETTTKQIHVWGIINSNCVD